MRSLIALASLFVSANAWAAENHDKELDCLALNIYHEARGEPMEGQLAVALVTMNRVRHTRYPDDVCGVVWQRGQFSWTHDGRSDRPRDKHAWKKAHKIASFVFKRYDRLRASTRGALDLTRGAIYYYAPKKVNPYWAAGKEITGEIGQHVFLKEPS